MWAFEITTGNMYDPNGKLVSSGYAGGNCGKNPEGIDNPDDEGLKNIGPLPEGIYTFGTPVEHSQLGAFAIPLIPDPATICWGAVDSTFTATRCSIRPQVKVALFSRSRLATRAGRHLTISFRSSGCSHK